MKVTINQIQGIALAGKGDSKHWVVMDGPEKFSGLEAGSLPMELFLISLAGCTGMDVVSLLEKMRVKLDDFKMEVEAERAETHPKVFTKIRMEYLLFGKDIDPEKVEKAIDLSQNKYCPASAMLKKTVDITTSYKINP